MITHGYRIRTEATIGQRRIENTLFLEDYSHPSAEECPINVATRIRAAIAEEPVLYLAELYEQADCQPDDVFKLIVDGALVADMDCASLSEPNRCRVFRDRAVRDFEYVRRPLPPAQPVAGILDLQAGQRLRYNHTPYTVTLVGAKQIVLTGDDGLTADYLGLECRGSRSKKPMSRQHGLRA